MKPLATDQSSTGLTPPATAPPSAELVQLAAESDLQFTLDLYRRLAAENQDNLFLSGHSVLAVLAMAAEGAEGPTAAEIGQVFHLPESLWRADPRTPWDFTEFSRASAHLEAMMAPGDPTRTIELHTQLGELEERWSRLRAEVQAATGNRQYELARQERQLVEQINALRQQIDPYQLRFANAIWCDNGFPLRDAYQTNIERSWGAFVFGCDFQHHPEEERSKINAWVSDQTNDRIRDLLAPGTVDPLTRLILTNAVYFKGNWESPFRADRTRDDAFFLASGEETTMPLMFDPQRHCRYVELTPEGDVNDFVQVEAPVGSPFDFEWQLPENPNGFKLVELPYRGGSMSMIVILPNRPDGLADLESQLTPTKIREWQNRMTEQTVDVHLPRFTMRNTLHLNQHLIGMGMPSAFDVGGFTGLSDSPEASELYIQLVVQQAFVEVNEEGTEAAAATAIVVAARAAFAPKPNPIFRADHPFLFYIQHRETGTILFMGRLTQPQS